MNFYIVDCFAESKYQGNQLAVFVPDFNITEKEMQQIANEMGFSETTFILSGKQSNGGYDVRIFTPDVEVPFAGHPTLGTAYVIHHIMEARVTDKVILNLKVGQIPVIADGSRMTMFQNSPQFGENIPKEKVAEVLSILPEDIREDYPVQWVSTGLEAIIVPLQTLDALQRCHVNHDKFHKFHQEYYKCNVLGFIRDGEAIRSRVFRDDPGFLEDPATGSANGDLAGYLLKYNFFGTNSVQYTVSQGSEMGRPSSLYIKAECLDGSYQILVGGSAYVVAEGIWK